MHSPTITPLAVWTLLVLLAHGGAARLLVKQQSDTLCPYNPNPILIPQCCCFGKFVPRPGFELGKSSVLICGPYVYPIMSCAACGVVQCSKHIGSVPVCHEWH